MVWCSDCCVAAVYKFLGSHKLDVPDALLHQLNGASASGVDGGDAGTRRDDSDSEPVPAPSKRYFIFGFYFFYRCVMLMAADGYLMANGWAMMMPITGQIGCDWAKPVDVDVDVVMSSQGACAEASR